MSQELKTNQPDFISYVEGLSISQLNTLSECITFQINKNLENGCVIELNDGTIDTVVKIHTEITGVTLKKSDKKVSIKQIKKIKHTNADRINYNNSLLNNNSNSQEEND